MIRETIVLGNKLGLHMRAANVLADTASRFTAVVQVARGDLVVNGKSIMGLMMLAAPCGTELTILADGGDEEEALRELVKLVKSGFGEELAEDPRTFRE